MTEKVTAVGGSVDERERKLHQELVSAQGLIENYSKEVEGLRTEKSNLNDALQETSKAFDKAQREFDEKLSVQMVEFLEQENHIRDQYENQIANLQNELIPYQFQNQGNMNNNNNQHHNNNHHNNNNNNFSNNT